MLFVVILIRKENGSTQLRYYVIALTYMLHKGNGRLRNNSPNCTVAEFIGKSTVNVLTCLGVHCGVPIHVSPYLQDIPITYI